MIRVQEISFELKTDWEIDPTSSEIEDVLKEAFKEEYTDAEVANISVSIPKNEDTKALLKGILNFVSSIRGEAERLEKYLKIEVANIDSPT